MLNRTVSSFLGSVFLAMRTFYLRFARRATYFRAYRPSASKRAELDGVPLPTRVRNAGEHAARHAEVIVHDGGVGALPPGEARFDALRALLGNIVSQNALLRQKSVTGVWRFPAPDRRRTATQ
jgi:hypothetical protein